MKKLQAIVTCGRTVLYMPWLPEVMKHKKGLNGVMLYKEAKVSEATVTIDSLIVTSNLALNLG